MRAPKGFFYKEDYILKWQRICIGLHGAKRMVDSGPSNILIGISSDQNDCRLLLSWAIRTLARPNDHIVALHVLVGKHKKKGEMTPKHQSKIRRAKAYVISVLGEFAKTCQSMRINLEARVNISSSVGRGLIKEVKLISAEYLLVRGSRGQSTRYPNDIIRYCFEYAPENCAVISVGKRPRVQEPSYLNHRRPRENRATSKSMPKVHSGRRICTGQKPLIPETKTKVYSPTTVLDQLERGSHTTEEYTSKSFGDSSIVATPSVVSSHRSQSNRKRTSPCKFIWSLLCSAFRRKNEGLGMSKGRRNQPPLQCFSHEEILNATSNFHPDNLVGRGGYSDVYRGDLPDGRAIAIKRLAKDNSDEKKEKEFLIELGIIGHVYHPNAASLVGYCIENGLYLIFNFSQNGNLASALHGKTGSSLDWPTRYKIAIGIARGLHYLHKCCKHRIIHRDIKASNILLGPDYEPQITDFGLAKWLPSKWTHHAAIPIEGTFGYLAPEYFMHGIVDEKTDVFAFGVLLLEIITGRRAVDSLMQNILPWAMPLMESGDIAKLADPRMEGKYDKAELRRAVLTASRCVRQSSIWRPTMSEVLELLINDHDSDTEKSWRIPKFTSDEMDDYSMVYGYDVPTDISLEDSF